MPDKKDPKASQRIVDAARQYPYVNTLLDLLTRMGRVPKIEGKEYWENSAFWPYDGFRIKTDNDSLGHELVHALQASLQSRASISASELKGPALPDGVLVDVLRLVGGRNYLPVRSMFGSLRPNPAGMFSGTQQDVAAAINPDWTKKESDYRSTNTELPAWAVTGVFDPDLDRAPPHVDSTVRTELDIALDLLNRALPRTPK